MDNLGLEMQDENTNVIFRGNGNMTDITLNSLETYKVAGGHPDENENIGSIEVTGAKKVKRLMYQINDVPPWYITIFLGFQHYLTMAGSTVSVPFILCPKMCMEEDNPAKADIITTLLFVSGIVTLLQSTFGTRLPIIQGNSFAFLVPTIAILGLPEWKCPSSEVMQSLNSTEKTELWQLRMREVQGAIICASIFEIFFGALGIVGVILKYITPMTIAPAIAMIGLSLFSVAAEHASTNWGIAALTIGLIIVFSQYLKSWKIPVPFTKAEKRDGVKRYPIFEVFAVLLTMASVWLLCFILTETGALKEGNPARTDIKTKIISQSRWFRVPYPFQWGIPTVTAGAVFGMLSGVLAGAIESIGDYYACARIAGAPKPPTHAINRGIFTEGVGCVLAGMWGTGNGTSSYSENIGAMSVTNVGSRRVIQTAGILMICCGLMGKVGAVFISIPEPIVGGVFCIVFSIVTAVGLSNLEKVDFNSSRNIFIIGFSIFFSLTVSQWMSKHPGAISIGEKNIDQVLNVLASTGMFMAGLTGFILDNTIPGTKRERGIHVEESSNEEYLNQEMKEIENTYDLPIGMSVVRRIRILRFLPISPTYKTLREQSPANQTNDLTPSTISETNRTV